MIGLVNCIFNLPGWQVKFFIGNSDYRRTVINPIHKERIGASQNGFQAIACKASCKADFFCTLNKM